jgi:hypothetical protein
MRIKLDAGSLYSVITDIIWQTDSTVTNGIFTLPR